MLSHFPWPGWQGISSQDARKQGGQISLRECPSLVSSKTKVWGFAAKRIGCRFYTPMKKACMAIRSRRVQLQKKTVFHIIYIYVNKKDIMKHNNYIYVNCCIHIWVDLDEHCIIRVCYGFCFVFLLAASFSWSELAMGFTFSGTWRHLSRRSNAQHVFLGQIDAWFIVLMVQKSQRTTVWMYKTLKIMG